MRTAKAKSIYVVGSDEGGTKIGISQNPIRRLIGLKGRCKNVSLTFQSEFRGDARTIERVAHNLLVEKRLSGEWFDVTPEEAEEAVRQAIYMVDNPEDEAISRQLKTVRGLGYKQALAKTRSQRVREAEAFHRARGEKQICVWVPIDDPEGEEAVRRLARESCAKGKNPGGSHETS